MGVHFKKLSSNQVVLFPASLDEKIPINHAVRLLNDIVDKINIEDLIAGYKGGGTSSYHPRMMIKVLFYAYFNNEYSCRKIAQFLEENIYFMWLSGNSTPDFRTINNFRSKRLKNKIQQLFAEIVMMMSELGYVSLDRQFVDGTKIESAANRYSFVWRKNVERHKTNLEEKIKKVISEIDQSIESDNAELKSNPAECKIDTDLLKQKIEEYNQKRESLNKKQKSEVKKLEKEALPRLDGYERDLEILGDRNSYSKTDHDASFFRMKDDHLGTGQLKPAYNVQISTESQIVTNFSIHQTAGDTGTFIPHIEQFSTLYNKHSKEIIADAGYGSEQNYEYMIGIEAEAYVKYNMFHQDLKGTSNKKISVADNLFYNEEGNFYVCPMGQRMEFYNTSTKKSILGYESTVSNYRAINCKGCPMRGVCFKEGELRSIAVNHRLKELKRQARERLTSEKGIRLRKLLCIEPESVFGQLKSNNRYNRFRMYGLSNIEIDLGLAIIGHNLRKMVNKLTTKLENITKTLNYSYYNFYKSIELLNVKIQRKIMGLNLDFGI